MPSFFSYASQSQTLSREQTNGLEAFEIGLSTKEQETHQEMR